MTLASPSAHVIGTATYSGDWVAVVQTDAFRQLEGCLQLDSDNGAATLTANFDKDEFTGDLDGLAMLEGTLSGNTFAGTDAAVRSRADHGFVRATFEGSFSGAIYGPDGAEAAGVFRLRRRRCRRVPSVPSAAETTSSRPDHLEVSLALQAPGPATGRAPFSYPVEEE